MRYTPYLDKIGVTVSERVPDDFVNVLDTALQIVEAGVEWGTWEGKRRKPCPENPVLLAGQPIGQYHCPACGMMVMAAMPHLSPAAPKEQDPRYWMGDYEEEYGQPWPPGYEDEDVVVA